MNTVRRLAMTAVASATSLTLVACGGSESPQPTESTASAPASTSASDASPADDTPSSENAPSSTGNNPSEASSEGTLPQEEAEHIVFDDAGVSREDVTEWDQSELDSDDGRQVWEIEFNVNATEYEYDIDAHTGEILSKEIG